MYDLRSQRTYPHNGSKAISIINNNNNSNSNNNKSSA